MLTLHLTVKGSVQGVNYRAAAKEQALRLGLTGWIKNTADGDVEATITGKEHPLQQFLAWCRQGPPLAKVNDIIAKPIPELSFDDFSIRRD